MAFEPLITTSGDVRKSEVPREILLLADLLARIHGTVTISREASGCHLYMASPIVLEKEGARELEKRHLAINVDRFFGFGTWRNSVGTYDADMSGMCMKTETPYRVSALKSMRPIKERGFPDAATAVEVRVKERYLVPDGLGNMVPEPPGEVTPITQLPPEHPAVEYLVNRGYDLQKLEKQFRCGYCHAETPERHFEENGIPKKFYAPLPGSWKDTPQGRIVFYFLINGSPVAWQARILEKIVGDLHMFWHPYAQTWDVVKMKIGKEWKLMPPFDTQPPYDWNNPAWDPSKYKTAKDAERNQMVGGLDAALAWNREQGRQGRFIAFGCEGPLDAGRIGPPALCLAGKFLSEAQIKLVCSNFQEFVYVGDNDAAGRKTALRVRAELGPKMRLRELILPKEVKDIGDLTEEEARFLVAPFL
jgi:hypothetical protein